MMAENIGEVCRHLKIQGVFLQTSILLCCTHGCWIFLFKISHSCQKPMFILTKNMQITSSCRMLAYEYCKSWLCKKQSCGFHTRPNKWALGYPQKIVRGLEIELLTTAKALISCMFNKNRSAALFILIFYCHSCLYVKFLVIIIIKKQLI